MSDHDYLRDPAEITLHTTRRGFVEAVAEGAFHYTQWSPDGQHLSVVAPQAGGGRLALFDVALDGGGPFEVSSDAPLSAAQQKGLWMRRRAHVVVVCSRRRRRLSSCGGLNAKNEFRSEN